MCGTLQAVGKWWERPPQQVRPSEDLHGCQGVQHTGPLHLIFCPHLLYSLHPECLKFLKKSLDQMSKSDVKKSCRYDYTETGPWHGEARILE